MSWLKHLFKLREKSDNEVVKPFLDHMEDLRWTLIKMIVVLIAGMTASFFYVGELTAVMKAPLERIDPKAAANLIVTSPTDPFMVSLTLAFFGGIALTLPFLIYNNGKAAQESLIEQGWGAAFVLITMVLAVNLTVRILGRQRRRLV